MMYIFISRQDLRSHIAIILSAGILPILLRLPGEGRQGLDHLFVDKDARNKEFHFVYTGSRAYKAISVPWYLEDLLKSGIQSHPERNEMHDEVVTEIGMRNYIFQ
ncbi:uncharacterized protein LOC120197658 [Hibiscus syriacus]|uniref:uncharacterized protein LOC120197658 n=1 Tax=Hibiscus syriacus TaxID=106335 RepID=UPI001922F8F8|nr:uncharacterized protein LOC120197658 [Hibiscus syriacus]